MPRSESKIIFLTSYYNFIAFITRAIIHIQITPLWVELIKNNAYV